MIGMWTLFNLKTSSEVTGLKPLKANLYTLNVYAVFWLFFQEKGHLHLWVCKRLQKEKFFFQLLFIDNTAVIRSNQADILVFL